MMIDGFAPIGRALANLPMIMLVFLVGFCCFRRKLFYQAACLALFSILVNVALKGLFKVPLSPVLGKIGYAFPSGHMQLATVFYSWLALHSASKFFRVLVFMILMSVGFSLVHYGYHDRADVLAGFLCGAGLILGCRIMLFSMPLIFPWFLVVGASLLMIAEGLIYPVIPRHAWYAYGVLLVLVFLGRISRLNMVK